MKQEQNDRKHLTPRQIINRYRKGEYVDESIETISSAISSCGQTFDSIAVAFPKTLIEEVYKNIHLCHAFYDLQKEGKRIENLEIPDYPMLKDILLDLSYPPLWESMQKDAPGITCMNIVKERCLFGKYHLDNIKEDSSKVHSFFDMRYKEDVEQEGLQSVLFDIVLHIILK